MKKLPWQTLTLVVSLVALAGGGFFAGYQWPREPPALEITTTPAQAELTFSMEKDALIGQAPNNSTLMIGETVVKSGEEFSIQRVDVGQIKWWDEQWAVILNLDDNVLKPTVSANQSATSEDDVVSTQPKSNSGGAFVASKSGTKYHPSTGCSFVDRIKPENRIYFSTEEEAQNAGYEPSTCLTK